MHPRSSNPGPAAVAQPRPNLHESVPATVEIPVEVRGGIKGAHDLDRVAEEVPVAMVYNGISHAVMMASPRDLEDLALGFSLSEAILDRADQLFHLDVEISEQGIRLEMHIAGECFARIKDRRRNMGGRTGCGLCGTESLAQAIRPVRRVPPQSIPTASAIESALESVRRHQPIKAETGATHGAAWCAMNGTVLLMREDVGRHNALDKLIGARIMGAASKSLTSTFDEGFALISSRASYEMVQKSALLGIGSLVAVSAPTAMAVRQAKLAQMNLIGFARKGRHVIYAGSFRESRQQLRAEQ